MAKRCSLDTFWRACDAGWQKSMFWDLLLQHQALRDAGRNPNEAHLLPPEWSKPKNKR